VTHVTTRRRPRAYFVWLVRSARGANPSEANSLDMRTLASRFFATLLLLAAAVPAFAVTYLVPSDREMIQRSDDVVVATAITSTVERTARGSIVTKYVLRIEDVLKGERTCDSYLTLTEIGGELPGGYSLLLSGMPVYVPGQRYLVFSDSNADGEPRTWGLELGQFTLQRDADDRLLALRNYGGGIDQGSLETYKEKLRDATGFMKYVRGIVAQNVDPAPNYFVDSSAATRLVENDFHALAFTRASYLQTGAPRFQGTPSASIRTALTPTGANGTNAATAGIAGWNSTSGGIAYSYFGQDDTAINGFSHCGTTPCGNNAQGDNKNTILYNDPNGEIDPPIVGRGGPWSTGATYSFGGETFKAIDGGVDVVIDNITWSQQCLLNVVVLHELGHTLGFRHVNQNGDPGPNPPTCNNSTQDCTGPAVMNSSVSCSLTSLQTWDQNAVATVYGSGPICTPASISAALQDKSITSGQPANVTVTAAGSANTYQWYFGNPTDTSNPVPGQTTATLTHAPTTTTTYWVRVSGCNTSVSNSNAVTVTVNQPTCTPPSITNHPQNQTITQGGSTFLTVGVSGTGPFTFQWFIGTPPNTSAPTGTNTNSISVQPGTTTSYWVRVIGQCDPAALSNAALVTVNPSSCPDVVIGAPTATKQSNSSFLLDVTANSGTRPLTYQWFQGTASGIGTFVGEGKTILVPAPTAPVSYWARAVNDCQKSANSLGVVTIAPCDLPAVGTQPLSQTIAGGASATLSVAVTSSTTPTIRWYRGVAPDKTTEVGTGLSFNTGPLTATTQFWASVSNTCGEIATQTATVTVSGPPCDKPAILTLTPAAPSTTKGQTVTLVVTASGSETRHYEWYQGASGDTSQKVGTDSNTFTAGPLSAPTQFWVKVLNACGDASSATINVEVTTPKYRSVRH
jgi:hypothetical protein